MRARIRLAWVFVLGILFSSAVFAGDWPTFGHDAHRSAWAKEETALNPKNVSGLELKWKTQLDNQPKSLTALTAPVIEDGVATAQGAKTIVYVAGSSNHVFALDAETGKPVWTRTFKPQALAANPGMWLCPNGLNATPTIDKASNTLYVITMDGKLVGLDLGTGKTKFGPAQFVPPYSKDWSLNFADGILTTTTSQGCGDALSGIYAIDVREPNRPVIRDLLLAKRFGAGVWDRGGAVMGEGNKIYASTGDGPYNPATGEFGSSVIAASLPELAVEDYFAPSNYDQLNKYDLDISSGGPVWFSFANHHYIAAGGKEGVVYLLDADDLGGGDHHTPLFVTPQLANDKLAYEQNGIWGALSAWQDDAGATWLYVPLQGAQSKDAPRFPVTNSPTPHGRVMAFKVVLDAQTGKAALEPAWISADLDVPEPPAIANGVVFVLATGENTQQTIGSAVIYHGQKALSDTQKSVNTHNAVLYALDAKTGKTLFTSGKTITSWVHFSGLAIADGRVYAVDHDSRVYCFGLKGER